MKWTEVEALLRRPGALPGVMPNYGGLGIANAVASALEALGASPDLHPPIPPDYLDPEVLRGVRRLVLLVLDGLGHLQLQSEASGGQLDAFGELLREGPYLPLTTVVPSTTSTALTTFCTGLTPQEHGVMGYRLFLKECGFVANMISMSRMPQGPDVPVATVDPERILTARTLFQWAQGCGIHPYVLTRYRFVGSPFSRMVHRGAEYVGYLDTGDMFVRLRKLLGALQGKRTFILAYADGIDTIGHIYGPRAEEHSAEVAALDFSLGRNLLDQYRDGETLLMITADHGHIETTPASVIDVGQHGQLMENLLVPPTGDARLPYLHVKRGHRDAVEGYLAENFPGAADIVAADKAFDLGLFGCNAPRPEARDRVGDLLLVPRGNHAFTYRYSADDITLVGRHGGLAPEEMLVPLVVHRFG